MLEKALKGDRRYWTWIFALLAVIGVGFLCYLYQLKNGLGITGLQGYALMGLQVQGPMTMTQISDYIKLSLSAMTRVVDKLVEIGLVERKHDRSDRRLVQLELTPAGQERSAQFRWQQSLFFQGLLAGLSNAERECVISGLAILADRMEQYETTSLLA